jgi:hypothetical protein
MALNQKEIKALKLAIKVLQTERRRHFAAGESAWRAGIRKDIIQDEEIMGVGFGWVEDDHFSYQEYSQAIERLEDLIEILSDQGQCRHRESDSPLFTMGG